MLLRTHLAIAFLVLLLIFNHIQNKIIFFAFLLLATFFVDIDTKSSRFGKNILLRPLQWIISHRGFFHSILALSIFSAIIYSFNKSAGLGFFTGYLLHLLLDALTPNGIKFFWPISNFKISFFIKSGSIIEEIIFVLVLLGDVFLIVSKIIRF
jgi:inner membrane protein